VIVERGITNLPLHSSLFRNLQTLVVAPEAASRSRTLISIANIGKCVNLVDLSVTDFPALFDFSAIFNLQKLRKLNLSGCSGITTIESLGDRQQMSQELREVKLIGCTNLQHLSFLKGCAKIRVLNIGQCVNLLSISSLINSQAELQNFNFSQCPSVASSLTSFLQGNHNFKHLTGQNELQDGGHYITLVRKDDNTDTLRDSMSRPMSNMNLNAFTFGHPRGIAPPKAKAVVPVEVPVVPVEVPVEVPEIKQAAKASTTPVVTRAKSTSPTIKTVAPVAEESSESEEPPVNIVTLPAKNSSPSVKTTVVTEESESEEAPVKSTSSVKTTIVKEAESESEEEEAPVKGSSSSKKSGSSSGKRSAKDEAEEESEEEEEEAPPVRIRSGPSSGEKMEAESVAEKTRKTAKTSKPAESESE
jgi:hypothetical protein